MQRSMRKLLAVAAVAVTLLTVACTPEERNAFEQMVLFRRTHGVADLAWEEGAYAKARAWSNHMADQGRISHSNLADGLGGVPWRVLGENVARNSSLDGALRALEASPGHRANLLNPAFKRGVVAAVHRNGSWWVTQIFIG